MSLLASSSHFSMISLSWISSFAVFKRDVLILRSFMEIESKVTFFELFKEARVLENLKWNFRYILFLSRSRLCCEDVHYDDRSLSWHHSLVRRKITTLRRMKQPEHVNSGSGAYSQRDKRSHSFNGNIAGGNLLRQNVSSLSGCLSSTKATLPSSTESLLLRK